MWINTSHKVFEYTGNASRSYRSYNLQNSITNEIMTNVNEEHIHPYTTYKDGTIASCNFSTLRNNVHLMTPCAIVSSSTGSSSDASPPMLPPVIMIRIQRRAAR